MGLNLAFKELNFGGQYMVVWCVPSATHVTRIHQSQNKVFGFRMFVTWFLKLTRILDQVVIVHIGTAAVIGDQ